MKIDSLTLLFSISLIAILQTGCSVFGDRSEETPIYKVLKKDDKVEIRRYESYIVAKTEVQGDYKSAQTDAFRILADYIFGNNKAKSKIAMTAPVEQAETTNEKIAMTAPVEQAQSEKGWSMSFMMPSKYNMETLPTPVDPRVKFEKIEPKLVAVLTFSGSRSEASNKEKLTELREWIERSGTYEIVSASRTAGYDPPWTLPAFRRNEVMYDVIERKK